MSTIVREHGGIKLGDRVEFKAKRHPDPMFGTVRRIARGNYEASFQIISERAGVTYRIGYNSIARVANLRAPEKPVFN